VHTRGVETVYVTFELRLYSSGVLTTR
jgi:hypothetical protein